MQTNAVSRRLLEDARHACVSILDIKNRIIAGLALRQIQVEIEMAVRFPHQKKEPRRVPSNFLQYLFQGDKLTASLSHSDRLAAACELHHLHEYHLQHTRIITESLYGCLQARHIPVMIGSPNIDQFPETPLIFVAMVCDIARKVSELTVAFDDRSVLIITELSRFVPFSAVLKVQEAALTQKLQTLSDFTPLAHRFFAEERVEGNAKIAELRTDHIQQRIPALFSKEVLCRFTVVIQIFIAVLPANLNRDVFNIIAAVAILRKCDIFAKRLPITSVDRET